ncbi:hypothetical protein NC797_07075 [Aquibacillus sp. 3ASR75-11]|uniref:TrbL/VirB6 plasmid conjugal transfer protein n=1 Tax=Terrihalobacillus insolitus TaxID=2950438 RepID=A0A9X4ALY5_9BACI|nr:hypothetical protein [Terrihalobacillus insolitus]MDC3424269.1 hypothetical protein [Terrihalobacillus insolitus]
MFGNIADKLSEIFQGLMGTFYGWLVKPFMELRTFKGLIFGKEEDSELAYGIFTLDELQNIYQPGMNIFVALAVTGMLVGIVMAGMKISSTGINPSNRTYVFEFLKDLAIVAIVFFNLSTLYTLIFGLNYTIINAFGASYETDLIELKESVDGGDDILGDIIIGLCLLGLSVWANFYYMMRKLTLIIFMIMGPLMVALYLIPQTKGLTMGWLKEFIGTVFIQSIHAALYWIVALMATSTSGLESIILYVIFIPTSEALRSLFGLGGQTHNALSKSGAMFGMSALAGMYGSIKGAKGDKSVAGALRGAYTGTKDRLSGKKGENAEGVKSTVGGNTGTDSGTTTKAEKMLKAGQITSKMGKATFGMAGAIAGAPMGPMGSMAGSTAGFVAGGVAGGLAGRAGVAGGALALGGAKRLGKGIKSGYQSGKDSLNADKLADKKVASQMADSETSKWASENKDSFMKDMKKKFPDAHDSSLNGMWNKEVDKKRNENLEKARESVGQVRNNDGKYANAQALANKTADTLTNNWANDNREKFMEDFDKRNPLKSDMTEGEVLTRNQKKGQEWDNAVAGKRKQYTQISNDTASKMSNGLDTDKSYINKGDFANAVGEKTFNAEKNDFKSNYLASNPNATDEEIQVEFEKQNGGQRVFMQNARRAGEKIKSGQLYSGNDVNTDYLASQLATVKTNQAKGAFLKAQESKGVDPQVASHQWDAKETNEYKSNLKTVANQIPKQIPLDKGVYSNKVAQGAAAIGSGVLSTVSTTVGAKEIGAFGKDTKVGKIATAGAIGYSTGFKKSLENGQTLNPTISNAINPVASGISWATKEMKTAITTPHVAQNVEGKQANFRDSISYVSGVVGGTRGYQVGSRMGMKINPYNNAVNQKVAEVSDIEHLAQQVDDGKGNKEIARGAVQLVTTGNQSYVQVRDKTGQTQVVSRYGTGDSSLKKGGVVYQDLSVKNGSLIQDSAPYKIDSTGGKIETGQPINVNPSQLLANRNTPKNPRVLQEVQAMNQQVDGGQFTSDQVIKSTKNIRMVITKDRSYMVGQDQTGKEYRVSPYGTGDARLEDNQVRQVKYSVRNRKLHQENVLDQNQQPVDYHTSVEPKDLIPPQTNKRLSRREEFEGMRHKSLGGTL